ncbi:hypothetical protein WJX73_001091 [Symbiochloris irregularis]|uniref:Rhodanese domain-containing protein n=1 Tax=Symbiochloris irregularis TaxID=706552 RepID=A0AAW1PJS0_9CHLO
MLPVKALASHSALVRPPVPSCPRTASRPHLGVRRQLHSQRQVRVWAGEWPDQELIDQALEEFPDKGVANTEEGRALVSNGGYTYLDVRPTIELDQVGKVNGVKMVNIPVMNGGAKWSSEKKKKVFFKKENPDFVSQVEKKFPDKDTKLLIGCSDGRRYAMDALMALDEAGYTNIVGLKGGFFGWYRAFDNKGVRRRFGEYAEDMYARGAGDSAGIHSSGAGFNRSDFVEFPGMPEYEDDE